MLKHSFVTPGEIRLSALPNVLRSVVTFGIVLTMYHPDSGTGALGHFLYPVREKKENSTALWCAPCVIAMLGLFEKRGVAIEELEIQAFGAATSSEEKVISISQENQKTLNLVLERRNLKTHTVDFGGHRARKIVFNPSTGEVVVARVNRVRKEDWIYTGGAPEQRND